MSLRERIASLLESAESETELASKLEYLHQLNLAFTQEQDQEDDELDSGSISEFLPRLFELHSDQSSPVRKLVAEILGAIGVMHLEFVTEIVPVLMSVLDDRVPAVARQAITCGINLFRSTLEKVVIRGLHTSQLDDILKSSWSSMLEFKEKIYSIAFQLGSGGVRLLALKFVEAVILLYTPDPNGSQEPPPSEGLVEFNISWLRGGHPTLNLGDLSIEASKRLGSLLDRLRFPAVKSVSNLKIIVLVNCLAAIARKRPPYYGRILPVLLGLDPSRSVIEGMHAPGAHHALKNAFLTCLKCTHRGAAPWRDRLVGALRDMKAGDLAEATLNEISKTNGIVEERKENMLVPKDEKQTVMAELMSNRSGRKRSETEDGSDLAGDDDLLGKRAKPKLSVSVESDKESSRDMVTSSNEISSGGPSTNKEKDDNGPVQQLVAMFGALVAQGEKAVGSLEILISSISADLLAEVVINNMRYLPSSRPRADEEDETLSSMTMIGSDNQAKYPASFLANVLSLSRSFLPIASQLSAHHSTSADIKIMPKEEEHNLAVITDGNVEDDALSHGTEEALSHGTEEELLPVSLPISSGDVLPGIEVDSSMVQLDVDGIGNLDGGIPGLESLARNDEIPEITGISSLVSPELQSSLEQGTSLDANSRLEIPTVLDTRSSQDFFPSTSGEMSEELSPKAVVTDTSSIVSSTETSMGLPSNFVLPKMQAPVIELVDDQKDELQNLAFMRIVEAYKHVAVAGGSQVRFSLLAYLAVEFPSELDQWKMLQKHILADYVNHEGHELTLRVLYRLFAEIEEERDFFSSTTATSAYEMFFLTVAETLKESFPPNDKSLSKLLGEAPNLPKSILSLLESLCSPGNCDKAEKEVQSADRVTQGLSCVWTLILHRPPVREVCLKIALQCAVHHLEEVQMKAIRLVVNKLYPLSSICQQIEDFAKEMLLSVMSSETTDSVDAQRQVHELPKDPSSGKTSTEHQSVSDTSNDISSEIESVSSSIPEAKRCMALYFALCTKKHSLLRQIFVVHGSAPKAVKLAVDRQIPMLVRTMGSSSQLLEIIADPPSGSEALVMQVLQTLIEGTIPTPELISTIKRLYDSKMNDVDILIPILPFLSREELLMAFPQIVNLSQDKFQLALGRILQGSSQSGPVLAPAEVLIAIHGIDPDRDGIPLKKVTDACNTCFEQRNLFTQQVLAKVLNQLVEQIPLPLLFMRTVLQAIGAFPALVDFIMDILSRLVTKQIWKYPKLWVGFLKCAQLTKPQSFSVLLQLPPPQLENALNRAPTLKAPLVAHASQPNIKSLLPRSVLVVLGLASDPQTTSPAQASQPQTGDNTNSDKEALSEKSKETSSATT